MVIVADSTGTELRYLLYTEYDFDIAGLNATLEERAGEGA